MSLTPPANPSDADVHAYVDGQLAPDRVALVESALDRDPELAARVADIRAQNAALRDALDPVLAEPIPDRLLAAAATRRRGRRSRMRRWSLPALAAAATLVIGVALGWLGRDALIERTGTPTTFARQAAFAHALYAADARRPVEVWASEEKSLVTWLTKRLGFQMHVPDLNGTGLCARRRQARRRQRKADRAVHVRKRRQATPLAADPQTVRRACHGGQGEGDTAFRYAVENGVGVFYWIDNGCGYAISGSLDRAQLLKIAHLVYGQLAAAETADPK